MKIITLPFKINAGEYLQIMFKMFVQRWWLFMALIISAVCLMSIFHIGFLFVALMLIFIVIPMLMSFLYICYGLLPESRLSILEKKIIICADEIVLQFEDREEVINLNEIKTYEAQQKWILLHFKKHQYCFFVIPYTAFESTEELRQAAKMLMTVNKN